ncbi:hypothetical protein BGW38_009112, partial [Lunasporangiospora selenospora]
MSTSEPLTNTLAPSTSATLTIRVIKSFEYRTTKNLILHNVDLINTTVGQLRDLIIEKVKTAPGFRPYQNVVFDTLKLYTKAHGAKTMNLIINMDQDEDWILSNDNDTLESKGIENETEISIFNRELYETYKQNPNIKCRIFSVKDRHFWDVSLSIASTGYLLSEHRTFYRAFRQSPLHPGKVSGRPLHGQSPIPDLTYSYAPHLLLRMPLVILSGLPSSGKTRRAYELKAYFETRHTSNASSTSDSQEGSSSKPKDYRIHLINDESLNLNKHVSYNTAADEKKARGALISAVERLLSKDDIVIVDGLNYIKGFRYQLYCVARAIGTPHCVVLCGCLSDVAREWNMASQAYPEKIFEELIVRFEEPDSRTKWDSPLFVVVPEDPKLPLDEIWDAVILKKAPPPNLSTVVKVVRETNYLSELKDTTQNIIQAVLDAQKSGDPTKNIK